MSKRTHVYIFKNCVTELYVHMSTCMCVNLYMTLVCKYFVEEWQNDKNDKR